MASLPELSPVDATSTTRTAGVLGLGTALPERVVHNDDISVRMGVDSAWIVRRTGIESRRRLVKGESITELAVLATQRALADAGVDAQDVDLILAATVSQEHLMPGMAPLVGDAIGAARAGAMDVGAACAGFVSALVLGASMIETGRASNVVVVGADALSLWTDPDDRKTAALFGDGAGAVVLSASAAGAVRAAAMGSDGSAFTAILAAHEDALIRMDGHDTFKRAVRHLGEVTVAAAADAGMTLDEIDLFIYHQANRRILASLATNLNLPEDRVVDAIGDLGNTSAASIPLALEQARRDGRLEPGTRVLLGAIGSGLVWSAVVVEWGEA